ncbi:MAG: bifunctional folylpolyglutamate synthase/dihydrofolate synthase [Candidatus Omnitrophica bacterium]|nr:bifunctional folylpolyglutamate synthase/dihydrofolate synthase [Candidatus Omnitrophota bacterium]
MRHDEAIRYLETFIDYEKIGYRDKKIFALERARRLAQIFQNPQESFRAVHVAGTKGKGSIAVFIAKILEEAGYRTALYTSPHIADLRERISINGEMIRKSDLASGVKRIKKALARKKLNFKPTYFEVLTILAFNYFKKKKTDYGVIEVGLGGTLDATNIVRPVVSVVAPISCDHTRILGPTLREIAAEKAGIIKERCVTVSSPQQKGPLSVIERRVERFRNKFILVGRDIKFKERYHDSRNEIFDVTGRLGKYKSCKISMVGRHQIENACSGLASCEALAERGAKIKPPHIKEGLKKARHSCRCEAIRKNPTIILDGAQNRSSARAIVETVKRNFKFRRMILVLGVSKDKDIKGICEELAPRASFVITTRAGRERAEDPAKIKRFIRKKNIEVTYSVKDAMSLALSLAGKEDLILVAGSFFVAGEAKKNPFRPRDGMG